MNQIDLSGHVALVTGASSGLGRAPAKLLAEAGATVIVNHPAKPSSKNKAAAVVAEIEAAGGQLKDFLCQRTRDLGPKESTDRTLLSVGSQIEEWCRRPQCLLDVPEMVEQLLTFRPARSSAEPQFVVEHELDVQDGLSELRSARLVWRVLVQELVEFRLADGEARSLLVLWTPIRTGRRRGVFSTMRP